MERLANDQDMEPLLAIEVRVLGNAHRIDAAAGFSVMELMRMAGVPIKAECGGAGVCATCHCRVLDDWSKRLPDPSSDELDKLDQIPVADDRSRLSCQIEMTDLLDGLVLELQPDSLQDSVQGNLGGLVLVQSRSRVAAE